MKRFLNGTVVPFLAYWWLLLTSITLRPRVFGADTQKYASENPCIFVFWHNRIFYMPWHLRRQRNLHALVSPSGDGEIIHGTLRLFGYFTVRGSSFRHGARALIALARKLRGGATAAMIADGSRGPALIAQSGAIYLAKLTGLKIVPLAWGAEWKKNLNSWDKTIFPLPFSRVNVVYGDPIEVPKDITKEGMEDKRKELEAALLRVTAEADGFSG
ncbi:MAG: lysophospholipid acyltransferase family protein [Nitrospinae bacterium]|nr:lysophospholipid acyltransferase family protein [Nitrospinota bacterium]